MAHVYDTTAHGGYRQAPPNQQHHQGPPSQHSTVASDRYYAAGTGRAPTSWSFQPSPFVPTFGRIPQALIDEHDGCVMILVGPTPEHHLLPPILTLPSGDEELKLFRDVCLQLTYYSDVTRRAVISGQEPAPDSEAVDVLHLALMVFRYPPEAGPAIPLLAEVIARMHVKFTQWWQSGGVVRKLELSQEPEKCAVDLRGQALEKLRANLVVNLETRWLFTILRALGHIPELWSFTSLPPDSKTSSSQFAPATPVTLVTPATQGIPLAPQHPAAIPTRVSAFDINTMNTTGAPFPPNPTAYHPPTAARASQPQLALSWGHGSPSAAQPPPYWQQSQFSHQQPAPPVMPEASVQDASRSMFQQSSYAYPSTATGELSSAMPTAATPSPSYSSPPATYQDPNNAVHFVAHRGREGSLRSLGTTSTRSHRSQPPTQGQLSKLEAILEFERMRLLQMECQRDKVKYLTELFYRSLYTELSRYFTASQLCHVYGKVTTKTPEVMDELARHMYARLERELAFVSQLL